jgi:hypothetical protein
MPYKFISEISHLLLSFHLIHIFNQPIIETEIPKGDAFLRVLALTQVVPLNVNPHLDVEPDRLTSFTYSRPCHSSPATVLVVAYRD